MMYMGSDQIYQTTATQSQIWDSIQVNCTGRTGMFISTGMGGHKFRYRVELGLIRVVTKSLSAV